MKYTLTILIICLSYMAHAQQDSAVKIFEGKKYVYYFDMSLSKGNVTYRNATVTVYDDRGNLVCPAIPTVYWFDKDPAVERGHVNRRNPNRQRIGINGLKRS